METSLTVREADGMLSELAGGGHLAVESRDGALFYSLPGRRGPGSKAGRGRFEPRRSGLKLALPASESRFALLPKNAVTPSLWSCVYPQKVWPSASASKAVSRFLSKLA